MIRLLIVIGLCIGAVRIAARAADAGKVREPAVAGLFYPKDRAALESMIDALLAAAPAERVDTLRALICPHAGYPFSGPVAASAYRLLAGREYTTVIVMGPSHWSDLHGAFVSGAEAYRTPLGDVPISPKARELASRAPFALEPRCNVQRPDWWREASHPPVGEDTADTWEHSVEVEVPFLQRTLKTFQLVSVVCGVVDPERAAKALLGVIDERTLLVASSDLSHFHSYDKARELDGRCVQAICGLDTADMEIAEEACGKFSVLTLMEVAKREGWKARLLDYRNSGDTSGDKSRVVGYAAIAFFSPPKAAYGPGERRFLLDIARKAVREAARSGGLSGKPPEGLDPSLYEKRGCFVTLTKHGMLRGCVGEIVPREALCRAVLDCARSSAISDTRFLPVTAGEVDDLAIEVSVLSELRPLAFTSSDDLLAKLRRGEDGVFLQIGSRGATYLPQVWDSIPNKAAFLCSLSEKAGCAPDDWRGPGVSVYTYSVESFKEP